MRENLDCISLRSFTNDVVVYRRTHCRNGENYGKCKSRFQMPTMGTVFWDSYFLRSEGNLDLFSLSFTTITTFGTTFGTTIFYFSKYLGFGTTFV